MTTEAPFPSPTARPQCPRCGTPVPVTGSGTQVIRCGGCGAALQVNVRPLENQPRTPDAPLSSEETGARPRRRPMVEVPGPRRPEPPPTTFTVELSQADIETEGLEAAAPVKPPPQPPPAAPPAPAQVPNMDTPWFAEDIERLPEASTSLGQLSLDAFEALPPLPVRPDIPTAPRSPAGGQSRPAEPRPTPSQEK